MILVCILAVLTSAYLAISFIEANPKWIVEVWQWTPHVREGLLALIIILTVSGAILGVVCS